MISDPILENIINDIYSEGMLRWKIRYDDWLGQQIYETTKGYDGRQLMVYEDYKFQICHRTIKEFSGEHYQPIATADTLGDALLKVKELWRMNFE